MPAPLPPLYHQLDGSPTQGEDCGPCADATAIAFMSRNRVTPDQHAVRATMGPDDKFGPTGILDALDAFASQADEFKKAGLTPPRYRKLLFGSWEDDVIPALRAGKGVLLAIDYGVINAWDEDHARPNLSGSPSFWGDHMIWIHGIRRVAGKGLQTTVWDSLHDARRVGIPDGPVEWPLPLIRRAAGVMRVRYQDGRERPVGLGRVAGCINSRSDIR